MKVDKVSGKGLSTNDFTDALLTKLNGIETGANKITIDSALSTTSTNPVRNSIVTGALNDKVDKINGKGLSTNDFTTAYKDKLDGIQANANYYVHPDYDSDNATNYKSSGLYKITINSHGHVISATAVAKSDITALGIPAQDTTYADATASTHGLLTAANFVTLNTLRSLTAPSSSTDGDICFVNIN